jgi:hypothetical protein
MTASKNTEHADALDAASAAPLAALSQALNTDAPNAVRVAFAQTQNALGQMRQLSASGADIAKLDAEAAQHQRNGLLEASRAVAQRAAQARVELSAELKRYADSANLNLSITEAAAKSALVPPVKKDAAARQLHRDEISKAVGNASGAELVTKLGQLVGMDADLDAEILSGYGQRLINRSASGPRDADELVMSFRQISIGKLINTPPRSRGQAQAVAALKLIPKARGAIAAVHQSAKLTAGLK